ncbi:MAG: DUF1573 domain-containing protein [Planctomycetaceae bacterium]|nr:DUF1573 domain-containing protein [Planctomycetaceae bacterium]
MKSVFFVAVVAVLLGAAVGVGSSVYRFNRVPTYAFSKPAAESTTSSEQQVSNDPGIARLEVIGSREFNFGIMSKEEIRQHTFVVKNVGDAPLTLQFIDKSCQCTDVAMSRSIVPPDEVTDVTLSWQPNNYSLDFSQIARFKTNDPSMRELDLRIKGRVQQIVRPVPASVSFDGLRANQESSVKLMLYGYRDDDLEVEQVEFLKAGTAEFFEASVQPLDSEQLAREPGAKSGAAITVTLKPGVPIGTFSQRIRLRTNQAELEPIDLPVQGSIVGNISVFGAGLDRQTGILEMGVLTGKQSHQRKLFVVARGADSAGVELKVVETDPAEVLEASFDEPTVAGGLKRYPLSIRIKPNGEIVDRTGSKVGPLGRIVIESNRPDSPKLNLYVSFLLEDTP